MAGLERNEDVPLVALVLERHLGHQTYAENLLTAVHTDDRLRAELVPVDYTASRPLTSRLPEALRPIVSARHEIRSAFPRRPDVVVFNTQVPAVIGPMACRRPPYILCTDVTPLQYDALAAEYDHRPDGDGPIAQLKHAWTRRVFAGASCSVGWSSWVVDSLVSDYDVPRDRALVIPPGVDLDRWAPVPRRRTGPVRLVFVGGDFGRKGGNELLAAFRSLPEGSAELDVVTRSAIEPSAGITVHTDLRPNSPQLVDLVRSADVFVLPSRAETFGIAAVEATAAGVPVVATDMAGLRDIVVDGVTGFRIPPGDSPALGAALSRLVTDVELRERFGAAARDHAVARFDARRNARRLIDLALSAANGSTG